MFPTTHPHDKDYSGCRVGPAVTLRHDLHPGPDGVGYTTQNPWKGLQGPSSPTVVLVEVRWESSEPEGQDLLGRLWVR